MPASDTHREYNENLPAWKVTRDCVAGAKAVKKARTTYLPKPNPEDTSAENQARYDDYLLRANFVNFTGSTKEGMLGMVFRNPMEIELPESLAYLEENATGSGLSLQQLTQDITGDGLETGRYGILVDYPQADEGMTQKQVNDLKLRANLKPYPAESIKNWRTMTIGGVTMLSMVVLCEPTEIISDDGFSVEVKEYHRVLLLNDEGNYIQRLYDEKDELIKDDIIPRKQDGSMWREIPFIFIGSQNNDSTTDKAPLYDIAEVNIAHYRNSADFEESCYMVGQPTPVFAGLNQGWVDANMSDGVFLGSRRSVPLPDGGSASLLQANSNQMPSQGMTDKELQMVKIGARIIQDAGGSETAEAAKIRFAGQNSKLGTIVGNVESGLIQAITWAGEFMGNMSEFVIKINREFYQATIDSQLITAEIMLLDRRVIGKEEIRGNLRAGGLIDKDRTDEEIDADAEEISPIE